MNWKEKYSFWEDRTVDGFVYRFHNEFEIRRHAEGEVNFQGWKDFDDPGDCRRAWRELCDRSFLPLATLQHGGREGWKNEG